jgi:ribosomal protein S18 acetylase RimI-like enzyme
VQLIEYGSRMDQHEPVIERVRTSSPDLFEAFERLLPQLSDDVRPDVEEALVRVLTADSTYLLVARVDGRIVGVLTLVVFHISTATKAWMEDVVVDEGARGSGIGEALVKAGIEMAVEAGAKSVDLTSHPSREAANRLYRRLGFEVRDTNLLRFEADLPHEGEHG